MRWTTVSPFPLTCPWFPVPAFITLDSVRAATPDGRVLFDNLNLSIGAERIGLVNFVVEDDQLLEKALEIATRLATGPSVAITASRANPPDQIDGKAAT